MTLLYYLEKKSNIEKIKTLLHRGNLGIDTAAEMKTPEAPWLKSTEPYLILADAAFPAFERLREYGFARNINLEIILLDFREGQDSLRQKMRRGFYDCIPEDASEEQIGSAIQQAVETLTRENPIYLILGAFRQQRRAITANVMRGFLQHSPNQRDFVEMQKLGLTPTMNRPGWLVLLQVTNRKENMEWDRTLMALSIQYVLEELAESIHGLQTTSSILDDVFAVTLQRRVEGELPVEMVEERLNLMRVEMQGYFGWEMSLYLDRLELMSQAPDRWDSLLKFRWKNVTMKPGIYRVWETKDKLFSIELPKLRSLQPLLLEGQVEAVESACVKMLEDLTNANRMDDRLLQAFYQEYLQIIYSAMWSYGWEAKKLFRTPEEMEIMTDAAKSTYNMKKLLRYVTEYFTERLQGKGESNRSAVRLACDYIDLHYKEPITRSDLASYTHLHPDYLTRCFKRETGATIREYITSRRMKAAKIMLHNTTLNVSEIAAFVGYDNYAYFTSIYHKTYGITPREEREKEK